MHKIIALAAIVLAGAAHAQDASPDAARQQRMAQAYADAHRGAPADNSGGSVRSDLREARHKLHQDARAAGHAIHQGLRKTGHAIHQGLRKTGHAIHHGASKATGH